MLRPPAAPSAFCVAFAACGRAYTDAGETLLRRLQKVQAEASHPVHFLVFYSDEATKERLGRFPNVTMSLSTQGGSSARFACSEEKLHLHRIQENVLWLDLDIIPVADVTSVVSCLKPGAWAAAAPESISNYTANWYAGKNAFRRYHPGSYFMPMGLNTGVMYFNTTLWRHLILTGRAPKFDIKSGGALPDQDAVNAYFQTRRSELSLLPLSYNYRGHAISGWVHPILHHKPGTGCAKTNSCEPFLYNE